MIETPAQLALFLAAWPAAGIAVFLALRRQAGTSVGLPLAYLVGWAIIHWPGAALYLIPDHSFYDYGVVATGFALSTLGLLGYVIGIFLARPRGRSMRRFFAAHVVHDAPHLAVLNRAALWFFTIGLFTQLVALPLLSKVPTVTAVLSGVASLAVTGACMGLHQAIVRRSRRQAIMWLLVAGCFPFITVASQAFLGFGVYSLIVVATFAVASLPRPRSSLLVLAAVPVAAYLALSLYATYMRDRDELREVIWHEQPTTGQRVERVTKLITDFEFLDLRREDHRASIDKRLNQNHLVGAAVGNMEDGFREFTYGESIFMAFAALIPRVLWPGKPVFAGSGDTVAEYTGMTFAEGTAVGVGQVLEFYINFGLWGVFFGYVVLGAVIRWFDFLAAQGLRQADYRRFVIWFVPGLGLLQAGGNLAEVTASVAAAMAAALAGGELLTRMFRSVPRISGRRVDYSGVRPRPPAAKRNDGGPAHHGRV